ncbi:MAG: xylosidase [Bacteroides sp.]|nr:xylosidase [Bacteroides sp.]
MTLKKIYYMMMCTLMALGTAACGGSDEDYIPPAIEPEKPGNETPTEDPRADVPIHEEGKEYTTYRGLVMAGYQGWFGTPGDGCSHAKHTNTAWYHYRENDMFKPGVLRNSIDMWPDMSEYTKGYDTEFKYPDGTTAQVYSAYDESSVLLHFKWMQEYGIDGVWMQRFVGEVIDNPDGKDHFDKVLANAMNGSDQYQRAIAVMYDLGGYNPQRLQKVLDDAKAIYNNYATTRKYYLHENGKPMIALWGVGFNPSERGYSNEDIQTLVDGLKEMGYSILLGVSTYWRAGGGDTYTPGKTSLHKLIKSVEAIMPWYVGRFGDINGYNTGGNEGGFANMVSKDLEWCQKNEVIYVPHCHPGSSDLNMHPYYTRNSRVKGNFYWTQLHNCIRRGCEALYIAMFDEIDEGTAIYKVLNKSDVPSNAADEEYYVVYNPKNEKVLYKNKSGYQVSTQSTVFMAYAPVDPAPTDGWCKSEKELAITFEGIDDDLKTDHYLWLTGQARKMLRKEIDLQSSQPKR